MSSIRLVAVDDPYQEALDSASEASDTWSDNELRARLGADEDASLQIGDEVMAADVRPGSFLYLLGAPVSVPESPTPAEDGVASLVTAINESFPADVVLGAPVSDPGSPIPADDVVESPVTCEPDGPGAQHVSCTRGLFMSGLCSCICRRRVVRHPVGFWLEWRGRAAQTIMRHDRKKRGHVLVTTRLRERAGYMGRRSGVLGGGAEHFESPQIAR